VTNLLGLNSQQAEAFQKTHQEAAQRFLAQRVKVQEARHQLMEAASAAEMDVSTLRFLMAEAGRQQVKLDSMVTETMLKEMEILDAEQRLQYMRILPINRFSGQNDGPEPRARRGGGRPRH
jgi:Spy/CpxP family protein refolding chaperone